MLRLRQIGFIYSSLRITLIFPRTDEKWIFTEFFNNILRIVQSYVPNYTVIILRRNELNEIGI